jgi:hypothetical protein
MKEEKCEYCVNRKKFPISEEQYKSINHFIINGRLTLYNGPIIANEVKINFCPFCGKKFDINDEKEWKEVKSYIKTTNS